MIFTKELDLCNRIIRLNLFDANYYLRNNIDVANSDIDPLLHFVRYGFNEGRQPSDNMQLFNLISFKKQNLNTISDWVERFIHIPDIFIPIVFVTNENYIPILYTAIYSLFVNRDITTGYKVYILHDGISGNSFQLFKLMNCNGIQIFPIDIHDYIADFKYGYISRNISTESYYRFVIPDIINTTEKIIYLDCDIIIKSDLNDLYRIDISDYIFGAVREKFISTNFCEKLRTLLPHNVCENYHNAGVLLYNYPNFIKYGVKDMAVKLISSGKHYLCHDQDMINIICQNRIKNIPMRWNFQWQYVAYKAYPSFSTDYFIDYCENFSSHSILHYSSDRKPWSYNDGYFANMFWRYAIHTPYYERLKTQCSYAIDENLLRG